MNTAGHTPALNALLCMLYSLGAGDYVCTAYDPVKRLLTAEILVDDDGNESKDGKSTEPKTYKEWNVDEFMGKMYPEQNALIMDFAMPQKKLGSRDLGCATVGACFLGSAV